MKKINIYPMLQVVIAALLFATSAIFSKMLLNCIEPVPLSSFIYLGSGIGMFLCKKLFYFRKNKERYEERISKKDIKWLIGSVLAGGVAAPIILMFSLKITSAATASLLLNFESVSTILIARLIFKEYIGKKVYIAAALITVSSIILTFDFNAKWGFSIGGLGVIATCVLWGIDNNFTKNISEKNPFMIVTIKGIGAGIISLVLAFITGSTLPNVYYIFIAMMVGFFSYGLSIVLFIYGMRSLGASRASILFGTSPFLGVILSLILLRETPNNMFYFALPLMIIGSVLILGEEHNNERIHESLGH